MTFQIQAGALRRAADLARPLAERRNTIPVLAHLRLEAVDGHLTVRANNLDAEMTAGVGGEGALPAITAPAAQICSLMARIAPEETVTLGIEKTGQLRIAASTLTARLYTLPAEDFPDLPGSTKAKPGTVTLQAGALLRLMDPTLPAVSVEEMRYYLNGIYLHRAAGALRAVATDGHRILLAEEPFPAEARDIPATILPRHAARIAQAHLRRMVPDAPVTLMLDEHRIAFLARDWTLRAKAMGGTFPDYAKVIPQPDGAPIVVHQPKRLAALVQAVTAVTQERSRPVRFGNGTASTLTLATWTEAGDAEATVPAEIAAWGTDAAHPQFGLQARYVLDLCRALPRGFTLRVKDGSSPIHVAGAEATGAIMPMRI